MEQQVEPKQKKISTEIRSFPGIKFMINERIVADIKEYTRCNENAGILSVRDRHGGTW